MPTAEAADGSLVDTSDRETSSQAASASRDDAVMPEQDRPFGPVLVCRSQVASNVTAV
jgi:hypothetical protein